jgi:PAS domain S-box-containing protein
VKIFLKLDEQKKELLEKLELEKSKNYLESILMSVNDSIIVLSLDGVMKTVNKAALSLWGYKHKEMIDSHFGKLFENDIYSNWLNSLNNYDESQNKTNFTFKKIEVNLVTKKKLIIPALLSGSALLEREGSIQGAVLVAVDISDRKRSEIKIQQMNEELEERVEERTCQLEQSNKDLESFSYSVSHDLRAPLRAISGFTNIIYETYTDKFDDEGKRLINVILDRTKLLGMMIDDILSFSRLGRKDVVKRTIDMNKLFAESFNEVTGFCKERNIDFKILHLPLAQADAALIKYVITNLLSNAVKFTRYREEANIEVGSFIKDDKVVYYVKDNGAGFDMEYADKLYGVFQRLHSDKEFEGTGVGLAIVSKIILKHGGKVWAEGILNEGATFYFSLPPK